MQDSLGGKELSDYVCEACAEAALEAGFGDTSDNSWVLWMICSRKGALMGEHHCEAPHSCECACIPQWEREALSDEGEEHGKVQSEE